MPERFLSATGATMGSLNPRVAVYLGSFDPISLGHVSVIDRSSALFERLVIGVGINVDKLPLFSAQERVEIVKLATDHLSNIEVRSFAGLAVDFARSCGAKVMVRGIRPLTDTATEFTMMLTNRQLDPEIETVFLMADEEFAHVSSSLIKQITPLSSDEKLARFVPAAIIPALRAKIPHVEATE